MKQYLQTVNPVNAPTKAVWLKIRQGDKVEEWHPLVSASYINGSVVNVRFIVAMG